MRFSWLEELCVKINIHTQMCCKCIVLICHFSFEYANSVFLPCKIYVRQIFSFIGPEIWLWLKSLSLHSRYKEIWLYIVSLEKFRSSIHLHLLIYMEWDMDPMLSLNQIIIQLCPNLLFINDHLFPSDLRCHLCYTKFSYEFRFVS